MVWNDIKHFKSVEFDSPDKRGSGYSMNLLTVAKLDKVRELCGFPLVIHSGIRTPEHNAIVGGVDSSAHELGYAADIRALSSNTRFKLVEAALLAGFRRIGIGRTFVHLDDDPNKLADVIWLY